MKVVTIVGARPQFVKAAAVSRAIAARTNLEEVLVHTGQHFDANMSDIFFQELQIPEPRYNLGIQGGGHGAMTGRMLERIEDVILNENPEMLLVYGDTNSTIAGALAAAKLHVPVAHIEAGLRSFNRRMPEETNRVLTDHISTLLLCPTELAVRNLAAEGIENGVHQVGDVMFDATLHARRVAAGKSDIRTRLGVEGISYSVATVHRAENTNDPNTFKEVIDYLKKAALQRAVVLPVHPRTRAAADRFGIGFEGLITSEPLSYMDMTCLVAGADEVLTDSGGLQKEAYFHRKPCITLRDETEWMETIEAGWNRLWKHSDTYAEQREIKEYGNGNAAERVVDILGAL